VLTQKQMEDLMATCIPYDPPPAIIPNDINPQPAVDFHRSDE